MDIDSRNWLRTLFADRVRFDEPMSRHTSLRIGGPADALVFCQHLEELEALLSGVRQRHLPWLMVGGGTNLLVKDGGIRGVVIVLEGRFSEISSSETEEGRVRVTAGAGTKLQRLCRWVIERGIDGLLFALGIPGTVGGAVRMNAGTSRGWMGDVLSSVLFLNPQGGTREVPRSRLGFGYRSFCDPGAPEQGPCIILEAAFALTAGDPAALRREADAILKERNRRQPTALPSAGCFFKNPPEGRPAGALIEAAGLKGHRIGGAEISPAHANFIVNRANATAADVLGLFALVRETVKNRFSVELEPEVQIVGS